MLPAAIRRFLFRIKTLVVPQLGSRSDIHSILGAADPGDSLELRVRWLISLIGWIRSRTRLPHAFETETGRLHQVRIKFILMLLDRNPEWKKNFAATVRSVFEESNGVELFCRTGLTQQGGMFSEGLDRLIRKILPAPARLGQLDDLMPRLFLSDSDADWVESLPAEILEPMSQLLWHDAEKHAFDSLRASALDALVVLTSEISARGLAPGVLSRLPYQKIQQSPFLKLRNSIEEQLPAARAHKGQMTTCRADIESCQGAIERIYQHLDKEGVSVGLVYHLECQREALKRTATLLEILSTESPKVKARKTATFLAELIRGAHAVRGFKYLVRNNLRLISQKIVERAAASGEHYISRSRAEYYEMFRAGLGGGAMTVLTTMLKAGIHHFHAALFVEGFLSALNYAGSFMTMQFLGFTLATKQPAMTGPALANKLKVLRGPREIRGFVDEVKKITRTQFAAVFGNIGAAFPVAVIVDWTYYAIEKKHFWSPEAAAESLHAIDPFTTLTAFYAIWTGVILWSSGIAAGWVENWFVWRQLPLAISQQRWIIYLVGEKKAKKLSDWILHNIGGMASCVELGILLGFTPIIGQFFGLPLDIRHVTLSSAAVGFAASSLLHSGGDYWLVVRGVIGVGVILFFNFSVSFSLAFFVAIRARDVPKRSVWVLIRRTTKELVAHPFKFFFYSRASA